MPPVVHFIAQFTKVLASLYVVLILVFSLLKTLGVMRLARTRPKTTASCCSMQFTGHAEDPLVAKSRFPGAPLVKPGPPYRYNWQEGVRIHQLRFPGV